MKTLLIVLCSITLLVPIGCADAGQLSYTSTIPLTTTNWSNTISFPMFDPALGTLDRITFVLTGHVEGAAMFESMETIPATVTANLSAKLTLMRPDNSLLVMAIPVASVTETVDSFDGTIDFSGASGRKYEGLSANRVETLTVFPPSADFGLFSGAGNIVLPIKAEGFSSGSGAGNLLLQFNTLASAQATITYDYTAVPEPSGILALLTGIGGMAGLLSRYRRA